MYNIQIMKKELRAERGQLAALRAALQASYYYYYYYYYYYCYCYCYVLLLLLLLLL